jgi:hypothetical protein
MDTAEVVYCFHVTMDHFNADCVEEETTGGDVEPKILETEVREDIDP